MLKNTGKSDSVNQHRKKFGQFFTPPIIARLMAQWITANQPEKILDPAFGSGVFYNTIIKLYRPNRRTQFTGYEIDPDILKEFKSDTLKEFKPETKTPDMKIIDTDTKLINIKIIIDDYLKHKIGSFDAIICNPPYMRFQNFHNRHNILPELKKQIGRKLSGYINLSAVFLVKSLSELNPDGRLAFIMPFEFFNSGYGKEVKKNLLELHLLKQIIVFNNEKEIFPEVTTTVCILLCHKNDKEEPVKITRIKNNKELNEITNLNNFYQHTIAGSQLPWAQKWSPILQNLFSRQKIPVDFVKLSVYGRFSRGIATGVNSFFALSEAKIKEWQLTTENICKCITKSPQIRQPIFTETDFTALSQQNKAVYCLNICHPENEHIRNYLQFGEQQGYQNRYLTRMRNPWYKIEKRKPAPILGGVFNRGRFKVIRNLTNAINFTCFHAFYPNAKGEELLNQLYIYMLSDIGQDIIKTNKRNYGNNLDKFEPGDLNDCLCPPPGILCQISPKEAQMVIELATKDQKAAIHVSNELIKNIFNCSFL